MIQERKIIVDADELDALANRITSMDMRSRHYLNMMVIICGWYKDGDGTVESCRAEKQKYRIEYEQSLKEEDNGNN